MNISSFDLNLLVAFDALLTERSVTRAARRLGLSQPAMSHALARLRDGVGDELFERARHGIVPTPRALAMAEPVRAAISQVHVALSSAPRARVARQELKVGANAFATRELLPFVIDRIGSAPRPLSVAVRTPAWTEAALVVEWADSSVGATPGSLVFRSPLSCVVRRGNPMAGRGGLGLREFLALGHVSVRSSAGEFSDGVDAALLKAGERREVVAATEDFESAAEIAAETDLAAVIPQIVSRSFRENLRVLTPPLRLAPIALTIASMRAASDDPLAAWARQEILAAGRRLSRGAAI